MEAHDGTSTVDPAIFASGDSAGKSVASSCSCANSRGAAESAVPVYAMGKLDAIFPSMGVQREYEFERAALKTSGPSDRHLLHGVLSSQPHIARAMCWILEVQGAPAYHLVPRSQKELDDFVDAVKPNAAGETPGIHVILGWRGPVRDCGGASLPTLVAEASYAFDLADLIRAVGGEDSKEHAGFAASVRDCHDRLKRVAQNYGVQPEHRALNYVSVRFAPLYHLVASASSRDLVITEIAARHSMISSAAQMIIDVVVKLEPRKMGVPERYFVEVDVTGLYPYALTTSMQPFIDVSTR